MPEFTVRITETREFAVVVQAPDIQTARATAASRPGILLNKNRKITDAWENKEKKQETRKT